jgi:hypothetical protein
MAGTVSEGVLQLCAGLFGVARGLVESPFGLEPVASGGLAEAASALCAIFFKMCMAGPSPGGRLGADVSSGVTASLGRLVTGECRRAYEGT